MSTAAVLAPPPSAARAPTLGGPSPLGVLPEFRRDPLGLFTRAAFTLGPVVHLKVPVEHALLVSDPALADEVLVQRAKQYGKRTRGYFALTRLLGHGLLTSDGDFWKRQRRIAQPAFHKKRVEGFADTMTQDTLAFADGLQARAAQGEPVDLAEGMMQLTLKMVGKTLLSTDLTGDSAQVGQALTWLLKDLQDRITGFNLPLWAPVPGSLRFKRARGALDALVYRVIAQRRRAGPGDDLLGMLMEARDEDTGEGMTDVQLRDEVLTLLLAGHETTANALAWTFALLSQHPHVERAVRAELAAVLQGRTATAADVRALPYLGAVVKESMRLYPPAWLLARRAEREDVLGGVRVPKGSVVLISPYVLHRAPQVWRNPMGFDPERFLAPDLKLGRCDYLPFSAGPRKCIGDGFAMMEAQLVLATLLQRFSFALVPGQSLEPEPLITLRPRFGVQMRVSPAPA